MAEERTSQPQAPSDGDASFFSDDEEEGEFEFPSVSRDSPRAGTADDGRVRPLYYPVFGRRPGGTPAATPRVRGQLGRLFLEESSSRARNPTCDDDDDDGGGLEGAPPESYCLWTPGSSSSSSSPSPRPPRKSSSTGSVARWRRISGLVVGRSHSFGKEKFVFFPAPRSNKQPTTNSKHHDKPTRAEPSPRKAPPAEKVDRGGTFLPYREELVGFFASVNGVSRSHQHPF